MKYILSTSKDEADLWGEPERLCNESGVLYVLRSTIIDSSLQRA